MGFVQTKKIKTFSCFIRLASEIKKMWSFETMKKMFSGLMNIIIPNPKLAKLWYNSGFLKFFFLHKSPNSFILQPWHIFVEKFIQHQSTILDTIFISTKGYSAM